VGDPQFLAGALLFAVGAGMLLYSGDCLVRGALSAGHKFNISPLLVSAAVVGGATTAPEAVIALGGALKERPGLAHGAILGSGIANILLVLPLCALVWPVQTNSRVLRVMAVLSALASAVFLAVSAVRGLWPGFGAVLLCALLGLVLAGVFFERRDRSSDTPGDKRLAAIPAWKTGLLVVTGLIGLPLGGALLVEGGLQLSDQVLIPEEIVGLALLAAGAALPEVGAGLAASFRRQDNVVMGAVLGASLFNVLAVGGLVALTGVQTISEEYTSYGYWALGAALLACAAACLVLSRFGRRLALVFLGFYALYIAGLIEGVSVNDLPYLIFERPAQESLTP